VRFLGALWMLCLFAAGCGNRDVTHSTAPEVVAQPQIGSTFELIERLEKAPEWTPEKVMGMMRIELRHDPDQSGPAFKAYTQPASSASPYKSVELRMPNGIGSNDQLLIVQLARDGGVTRKDIIAHYGLEFDTEVPSPEARDLPTYLRYKRPGGYVSLGVTHDDDARLVSFVISKNEQ
jgi:hypothetical protein